MLVTGLLLALATSPAPAVDLRWDAPAGCPPQAELERQVSALLAGHTQPASDPPRVAFQIQRRGPRWLLHGEIDGAHASGRRDLQAATCSELVEAAALIVAIAVDPSFVPGRPASVPPAPPPAEPEPTAPTPGEPQVPQVPTAPASASLALEPRLEPDEPTEPTPEPTPTQPSRRPTLLLGLSAGLGLGALPAPAGLLRLVLGLQGRRWSAAVVQDFWLPRDTLLAPATPGAPTYGGRFWLWSAGLRGCASAPLGRILAVPVCATVAVGVHSGEGIGAVTRSQPRTSPWLGLAVGPGLALQVRPRVRLTLAGELLGILARPDFRVGQATACCADRLGAQFTAGVLLVLPGKRR